MRTFDTLPLELATFEDIVGELRKRLATKDFFLVWGKGNEGGMGVYITTPELLDRIEFFRQQLIEQLEREGNL